MKFRFFILYIGILLGQQCGTTKMEAIENVDEEEWEYLYNGRNFFGWDIKFSGEQLNHNYKNTFIAMDSFIRIQYNEYETFEEKYAHMYYHKPFSHFKLKFDYRFFDDQVDGGAAWNVRNSGIMFHSQSAQSNDFEQHFPVSIEMQLLGGLSNDRSRTTGNMCSPGTNVVFKGELDETHCISSRSKTYHGDQWVSAELVVYGDSIVHHIIEGDTVLSYSKPQVDDHFVSQDRDDWRDFGVFSRSWKGRDGELLSSGYVALQAESHPIDFRNLRILDLNGCMDPTAKNYKRYFIKGDPSRCSY